jgi:hypothetical protein
MLWLLLLCYYALQKKKTVFLRRSGFGSGQQEEEEGGREGGPFSYISYKYFIQMFKGLVFSTEKRVWKWSR